MTAPSGPTDQDAATAYRVHVRHEDFSFEHVVHATQVDKEDGWTVFWSGNEVFMRLRDEHIVSLELLA